MVFGAWYMDKGGKIVERPREAMAQAPGSIPVSGYAWSEHSGWIKFSSSTPPAEGVSYGVGIDPVTGDFSGYAWSEHSGWIDFAPAGPYPGQPAYSAKADLGTGQISGWARILSLGSDGWLKLRNDPADGGPAYGVSINTTTGDFSGFAWNANANGSGIGWVSFNCVDTGACASSDYKVSTQPNLGNNPPLAAGLTAPNWSFGQASGPLGALNAILRWTFSDPDAGSSQSAYRVVVNTSNNPIGAFYDTGKLVGAANQVALNSSDGLSWGTAYYWWAEVWDDKDTSSGLIQYNSPTDTDNNDGNLLTFTTYLHEFPDVYFIWLPLNPSQGEDVNFFDATKVYLTGAPTTPVDADATNVASWEWTFNNGNPATATVQNPTAQFLSSGNTDVSLKVTDNDGYYSSTSTAVNANLKLPSWIERKPD